MPTYKGRVGFNDTLRTLTMTEKDYTRWKACVKTGDFFELKDGRGCTVYSGDPSKVQDIQEVVRGSATNMRFICGYGHTHPIHGSCDCVDSYGGMLDIEFRAIAMELYGKNIKYHELQNHQRDNIRGHWRARQFH